MTEDHHQSAVVNPDLALLGNQTAERIDDIVAFRSTGKTVHATYEPNPNNAAALRAVFPKQESSHEIRDFADRDVLIENIKFDSKLEPGEVMKTYDIMDIIQNHANYKFLRNKLEGMYGVTFDCQLTTFANAQPYEQGLFQIVFVPFEATSATNNFLRLHYSRTEEKENTLPFTTGCPVAEHQLPSQTEVSLKVPYVGPSPFINLTNIKNADFGAFYLQCICPLDSATTAPELDVSVLMRVSNIQPYGATPATFQGPSAVRMDPQGLESVVGEISKTVQPGNIINSVISSATPLLKTGINTALASSPMALMGLSKPIIPITPSRVFLNPYESTALNDTGSSVIKLAMCKDQSVRIDQLGIDKKDEMDINYFISRPTYLKQFTWKDSDAPLTELRRFMAEPNCQLFEPVSARTFPTRFRYASNFFAAWRGTTRFRFKIVCTQYHIGRLRFVYVTGGDPEIKAHTTEPRLPLAYTFFVDIHGPTEFSLDCGYYASTLWRALPHFFNPVTTAANIPGYENPAGTDNVNQLFVLVEKPLRTNEVVASKSIQIVVFQSGCDDVQFAAPCATMNPAKYVPPKTTRSSFDWIDDDEPVIRVEPQGIDDQPVHNMVGSATVQVPDNFTPQVTVGERIDNFRAMLRRHQPTGRTWIMKERSTVMLPFCFRTPYTEYQSYNLFEGLLPCYKFFRGGLRYQIQTHGPGFSIQVQHDPLPSQYRLDNNRLDQFVSPLTPMFQMGSSPAPHDSFTFPFAAHQAYAPHLQGGATFEVPYQSIYDKCLVEYITAPVESLQAQYDTHVTNGRVPMGTELISFSSNNEVDVGALGTIVSVLRATADDFNLGYCLGAPPTNYNVLKYPAYYLKAA